MMNKQTKKIKENNLKKFYKFFNIFSGIGSKSLPLTVFLTEKTEPNYETAYFHTLIIFLLYT